MTAAPFAAEVELALRATLLIGAAWAAAAMLRKAGASAATRHMVWLLGVAALLVLPLFWWLAPPLRLPILGPEAAAAATAAIAPPPAAPGAPGWKEAFLIAYLLGVAALLLRFAFCRRLVARLWRDAEPPRDAAWGELLSSLSREMLLARPVALRIARGPAMPMTWGTLAPKVLLPAEASAWPPERRRLVLLHELAHIARRDSLSRSAASLACALYWFHPGAWFAARRMRLEQEYAADDRVLSAGAPARTYALSLLDLARRVGAGSRPDHAAAMAGMCQLERRLVSITAPARRERPAPASLYASAAVAMSVTLAVATGIPVRPLSVLPGPLLVEPDLLATPFVSAPTESEARMPSVTQSGARRDARPRDDVREGPILQADGGVSEPEGQDLAPVAQALDIAPPQSESIGRDSREAPAATRQLAVYGPQLPPREVEADASDPRIPEMFRQSSGGANSGQAGDRYVPPRSRRSQSRPRFWVGITPVQN